MRGKHQSPPNAGRVCSRATDVWPRRPTTTTSRWWSRAATTCPCRHAVTWWDTTTRATDTTSCSRRCVRCARIALLMWACRSTTRQSQWPIFPIFIVFVMCADRIIRINNCLAFNRTCKLGMFCRDTFYFGAKQNISNGVWSTSVISEMFALSAVITRPAWTLCPKAENKITEATPTKLTLTNGILITVYCEASKCKWDGTQQTRSINKQHSSFHALSKWSQSVAILKICCSFNSFVKSL